MTAPEGHITIVHGSMSVNVPVDLFSGPDAEPVEERARDFKDLLRKRYPWLSENATDVIMRNARKEMLRIIDDKSGGRTVSKRLAENGKYDLAIRHLKKHLEVDPEDADSWYALGEMLCRAGRTEEGYEAMRKGRSLF